MNRKKHDCLNVSKNCFGIESLKAKEKSFDFIDMIKCVVGLSNHIICN